MTECALMDETFRRLLPEQAFHSGNLYKGCMTSRLIAETSRSKKHELDVQLTLLGQTVTQWVDEALNDVTHPPTNDEGSLLELPDGAILAELSMRDWSFEECTTNYLTHDIHPYPAKFIPQIPRRLIANLSEPGEIVWDPFSGSGTTAVEALLAGREAIGTDANPLSAVIGRAKCSTIDVRAREELSILAEQFEALGASQVALRSELLATQSQRAALVPAIPNIDYWFSKPVIEELALIRLRIDSLSRPLLDIALAALSKSIVRVSNQDSETRYSRREKKLESGSVLRIFSANLNSILKRCAGSAQYLRYRQATFATVDLSNPGESVATSPHAFEIADGSIDLVVTSPPYPNATDYHLYHRFRLFWLGYDPRQLGRIEIGSHLRHQKQRSGIDEYVAEMTVSLNRIFKALRPGRYAAMVLGDALYDGTTYSTSTLLARAAETVGFEVLGSVSRRISTSRRSFIAPARRAAGEEILILKRPGTTSQVTFVPPFYKMWPFEHALRTEEVRALTSCKPRDIIRCGNGEIVVKRRANDVRTLRLTAFNCALRFDGGAPIPAWNAIIEASRGKGHVRNSKYATHGLHAYKGKYYPQLARCLINLCLGANGGSVLDPFCGSGTTLLEAYLSGRHSYGLDLNPLAVLIARAKVGILTVNPVVFSDEINRVLASITTLRPVHPAAVFSPELLPELSSWFPPPVLRKLAALRIKIDAVAHPHIREFLLVVLSSIVRKVSHQEPRDLRIRRRLEPIEDAAVYELFAERVQEQLERVLALVRSEGRAPAPMLDPIILRGDCRSVEAYGALGIRSADCIVTSPPYSTALPYIDTDRLSLLLVHGLGKGTRGSIEQSLLGNREIGSARRAELNAKIDAGDYSGITSTTAIATIRRLRKLTIGGNGGFRVRNTPGLLLTYFAGMSEALERIAAMLKPGGKAALVIGDSVTHAGGKTTPIPTTRCLTEMADAAGLRPWKTFAIDVTTQNQLHVGNAIRENAVLLFTKR